MIADRLEKGSIGFTAEIKGSKVDVASPTELTTSSSDIFAPPKEDVKKGKGNMLDLLEPADLVRFGFIPE